MAITTVAYQADDTAYVQVKAAQTIAAFIQWMEGPPARIIVAAAQPAIGAAGYVTIGEAGVDYWQTPVLGATDLVWVLADTHVLTQAENGGVRGGTKTKVVVVT